MRDGSKNKQIGKHLTRCVSENHIKAPIIPFGTMVEYFPISAKDQSKLHQFGEKEVLPRFSFDVRYLREGVWKGVILVADIGELETLEA